MLFRTKSNSGENQKPKNEQLLPIFKHISFHEIIISYFINYP